MLLFACSNLRTAYSQIQNSLEVHLHVLFGNTYFLNFTSRVRNGNDLFIFCPPPPHPTPLEIKRKQVLSRQEE
jgi:hypothetical protein